MICNDDGEARYETVLEEIPKDDEGIAVFFVSLLQEGVVLVENKRNAECDGDGRGPGELVDAVVAGMHGRDDEVEALYKQVPVGVRLEAPGDPENQENQHKGQEGQQDIQLVHVIFFLLLLSSSKKMRVPKKKEKKKKEEMKETRTKIKKEPEPEEKDCEKTWRRVAGYEYSLMQHESRLLSRKIGTAGWQRPAVWQMFAALERLGFFGAYYGQPHGVRGISLQELGMPQSASGPATHRSESHVTAAVLARTLYTAHPAKIVSGGASGSIVFSETPPDLHEFMCYYLECDRKRRRLPPPGSGEHPDITEPCARFLRCLKRAHE